MLDINRVIVVYSIVVTLISLCPALITIKSVINYFGILAGYQEYIFVFSYPQLITGNLLGINKPLKLFFFLVCVVQYPAARLFSDKI